MDLLPLFAESLSLLPPEERWQVCFATYYTVTPAGSFYHWRGVVAGSAAAREALKYPGAAVIDLTKPLGAPGDDVYSRAAQNGATLPAAAVRLAEAPVAAEGPALQPPRQERQKKEKGPVALADDRSGFISPAASLLSQPLSGLSEAGGADPAAAARSLAKARLWIYILATTTILFLATSLVGTILLLGGRQTRDIPDVIAAANVAANAPRTSPQTGAGQNEATSPANAATSVPGENTAGPGPLASANTPAAPQPETQESQPSSKPSGQENPPAFPPPVTKISPQPLEWRSRDPSAIEDAKRELAPEPHTARFRTNGDIEQFVDLPPEIKRSEYRLRVTGGKAIVSQNVTDPVLECIPVGNELRVKITPMREDVARDFVVEVVVSGADGRKRICQCPLRLAPDKPIDLQYGYSENGDLLKDPKVERTYRFPAMLGLSDLKSKWVIDHDRRKAACQSGATSEKMQSIVTVSPLPKEPAKDRQYRVQLTNAFYTRIDRILSARQYLTVGDIGVHCDAIRNCVTTEPPS